MERYTPENITSLRPNEIFVFGSNLYGRHGGGGAARIAFEKFGVVWGIGDCWPKGEEFWKRIRAQYDVTDVIENGYMVWVRTYEDELRCITYYSKMNYWEEIEFIKKYPDSRFIDSYGNITVLVDKDGEFRVLYSNHEVSWWSLHT